MSNTYEWSVVKLDVKPKLNNLSDVVVTVHWSVISLDTLGHASAYSSVTELIEPTTESFTEFANLSEYTVIGWVQSALGEEEIIRIKKVLDDQIISQIAPAITSPNLPWKPIEDGFVHRDYSINHPMSDTTNKELT